MARLSKRQPHRASARLGAPRACPITPNPEDAARRSQTRFPAAPPRIRRTSRAEGAEGVCVACSRGHAPRVCETSLDDRRTGDRSTLASGDPPAIAFPATPSRRPSTTTARREVDRPQPTRHLPRPTTTGGRLSTRYAAPAGPPPSPGGYGKARPAGSTHDAYGDAAEILMGRTFAQHSTVCTGDVQQTMRCSSTSAKPCATRKPLCGKGLRVHRRDAPPRTGRYPISSDARWFE